MWLKSGRHFGPIFVDFVTESTKALEPFLGASGPLTLLVKGATTILRVFNRLNEIAPIVGTGAGDGTKRQGNSGVVRWRWHIRKGRRQGRVGIRPRVHRRMEVEKVGEIISGEMLDATTRE